MSLFKVGEECILQSQSQPQLNGDCAVLEVLPPKKRSSHMGGGIYQMVHGCCYYLSIDSPSGVAWHESALRKKHKPSTQSLSTMIETANKVRA